MGKSVVVSLQKAGPDGQMSIIRPVADTRRMTGRRQRRRRHLGSNDMNRNGECGSGVDYIVRKHSDSQLTDLPSTKQITIESTICSDNNDMEQDIEMDDFIASSSFSPSSSSDSDDVDIENEECPDEELKKFLKEVHQRKLITYKRAGAPYTNNERELRKHVRILRSNTTEEIIIFPHAGKPRNIRVLPRIRETPNVSVNPHEDIMQEWIDTYLKLS